MKPENQAEDDRARRPIRLSIFLDLIAPLSDYLREQEVVADEPNLAGTTAESFARLRRYLEESTEDPTYTTSRFLWIDREIPSDLDLFAKTAGKFELQSDNEWLAALARGFEVACQQMITGRAFAARSERETRAD